MVKLYVLTAHGVKNTTLFQLVTCLGAGVENKGQILK